MAEPARAPRWRQQVPHSGRDVGRLLGGCGGRRRHRARPPGAGLAADLRSTAAVSPAGQAGTGCGGAGAAVCLAIAPVTDSSPCSSDGDAGIQPVAIAVQRFDRGRQPPRLALAFPGDRLDLLRLARQIDRRDLVAPPSDRRLVGEHRQHHRADRRQRPTIPSRHSARRSNSSSSARKPVSSRRYFQSRSWSSHLVAFFAIRRCRPSRGLPKSHGKH